MTVLQELIAETEVSERKNLTDLHDELKNQAEQLI